MKKIVSPNKEEKRNADEYLIDIKEFESVLHVRISGNEGKTKKNDECIQSNKTGYRSTLTNRFPD